MMNVDEEAALKLLSISDLKNIPFFLIVTLKNSSLCETTDAKKKKSEGKKKVFDWIDVLVHRSSKDKQVFISHISNLKSYTEGMEQLIQQCKVTNL